jgi:hypothetical protein
MGKKQSILKLAILLIAILTGIAVNIRANAQQEIALGSHATKGISNTSITTGEGIGTKMNAGKKKVQLKSLEVNLINEHPDSVMLYVRLFPIHGKTFGENMIPNKIYTVPLNKNQILVDLSDLNLFVSGEFVVGLEWAITINKGNNKISYHSGLGPFKKGIYYKEANVSQWKKIPLFGFDMVLNGTTE